MRQLTSKMFFLSEDLQTPFPSPTWELQSMTPQPHPSFVKFGIHLQPIHNGWCPFLTQLGEVSNFAPPPLKSCARHWSWHWSLVCSSIDNLTTLSWGWGGPTSFEQIPKEVVSDPKRFHSPALVRGWYIILNDNEIITKAVLSESHDCWEYRGGVNSCYHHWVKLS